MAKQMHSMQIVMTVPYNAGVRDDANIKVSQVNYVCCDSGDEEMKKPGGLNEADSIPETVAAPDLGDSGTQGDLLYKLNALEQTVKTKESIA